MHALLARGRRSALMLRQLHGILATAAEDSSAVAQCRSASVAAGEVALRSAALPRHSPAWLEARRARKELEQLERLTRHLRKGVMPSLYYIEAAHGELLAALQVAANAWEHGNHGNNGAPLQSLASFFGAQCTGPEEEVARIRSALSISDVFSTGLSGGPWPTVLPIEDHSHTQSASPQVGSPRISHHVTHCLPAPHGFEALVASRSPLSPHTSVLSSEEPSGLTDNLHGPRSATLDDVVVKLRSFVQQRRSQISSQASSPRSRGSPSRHKCGGSPKRGSPARQRGLASPFHRRGSNLRAYPAARQPL